MDNGSGESSAVASISIWEIVERCRVQGYVILMLGQIDDDLNNIIRISYAGTNAE